MLIVRTVSISSFSHVASRAVWSSSFGIDSAFKGATKDEGYLCFVRSQESRTQKLNCTENVLRAVTEHVELNLIHRLCEVPTGIRQLPFLSIQSIGTRYRSPLWTFSEFRMNKACLSAAERASTCMKAHDIPTRTRIWFGRSEKNLQQHTWNTKK